MSNIFSCFVVSIKIRARKPTLKRKCQRPAFDAKAACSKCMSVAGLLAFRMSIRLLRMLVPNGLVYRPWRRIHTCATARDFHAIPSSSLPRKGWNHGNLFMSRYLYRVHRYLNTVQRYNHSITRQNKVLNFRLLKTSSNRCPAKRRRMFPLCMSLNWHSIFFI